MSAMSTRPVVSVPAAFGTIVRFTVIDGLRSRWAISVALLIAAMLALSAFAGNLAISEAGPLSLALLAPGLRLAMVLGTIAFVASAVAHDFTERALLMMLAAPVSRTQWALAKFCGFALLALAAAAACGLCIEAHRPAGGIVAVLAWCGSLALELMVTSAVTLMIACALRQVPAAVLASMGFYLLSRLIGAALLLNARSPIADRHALAQWGTASLEVVGALMPRLDRFTQTGWLLGDGLADLSLVGLQAALACAAALCIAAIDLGGRDV